MSILKRCISLLLVLSILLGVLAPAAQAAQVQDAVSANTGIVSIEAANGVGSLLNNTTSGQQERTAETGVGYEVATALNLEGIAQVNEHEETKPIPAPLETSVNVTEQGNGTEEYPYRITSEDEFALISLDPDAYYIVGADFTVSQYHGIEFSGVFNGNHHTIKLTNNAALGLFQNNAGTIKNLNLKVSEHLDISGASFGNEYIMIGCVSSENTGIIQDCTVQGTMSIDYLSCGDCLSIGGITGRNSNNGTITRCWSDLDISIDGRPDYDFGARASQLIVGGIAGENYGRGINPGGYIIECLNTGDISAKFSENGLLLTEGICFWFYSGGIVGCSSGNITSCIQAGETIDIGAELIGFSSGDLEEPEHYLFLGTYYDLQTGFVYGAEYNFGTHKPIKPIVEDCYLYEGCKLNLDRHDSKFYIYEKTQHLPEETLYSTMNYSEIKEWWNTLDRTDGENENDENTAKIYTSVRFMKEWNAENQTAYFGMLDLTGCQITEETDVSFLENVTDLVGQYVLVESKGRTDNMIGPDTLLSINSVETSIGTIQSFDADTITIDDVVWNLGENVGLLFAQMDTEMIYHIYEGTVVGVDPLQTTTGLLSGWDAESGELSIHYDSNKLFRLSHSRETELVELLNNSNMLDPITVTHDSWGIVYRAVITKQNHEPNYEMRVYSAYQQLSMEQNYTIEFICALFYGDELVDEWEKPVLTVGDSNVVAVTACEKLESGYGITLEALSPGTTIFTITDGDSGTRAMLNISVLRDEQIIYSYIIDEVPSFYPDVFGDRKTQTNVYNCNGLYVNNFPTELTKLNGNYVLEFDVYNSLYMYGSVDVFDNAGNWIESYRIDKHTSVHGLWDTAKSAVFLVRDAFALDTFSYTASTYSAKTHVEIEVPEGGYFTISTNYAKSPGVFLYNAVDYFLLAAKKGADLLIDDKGLEEIQNATLKEILATPEFADTFYKQFSEIALLAGTEAITGGYGALAGTLTVHAGELFNHLKIDFWGIVSICSGAAEEVLLKLTPLGMGEILKGMFKFSEICDITGQTLQISRSVNKGYVAMYTPEATGQLTISGVTVTPDEGALPDRAVAQVFRVTNRDALIVPNAGLVDTYEEYNISFVTDGSEVQPKGKVTVKIPVPKEYLNNECIVLHQQEDGTWQMVEDTVIVDGFIVFTADHFSCFAVAPALKQTGICGKQVYWKLKDDGELIITGNGAINNYSSGSDVPWYELRSNIEMVVIGEGVTSIGNRALMSCEYLTHVSIAEDVTEIGDASFAFCMNLEEVVLPSKLTSIGNSAFHDCPVLRAMVIPDTVESIGQSAFRNCKALTEVVLSEGLCGIQTSAFYGCTSLEKILIPNNINTIGSSAFYGCSSLVAIDIPENVTDIGACAFQDCTKLEKVMLSEQLEYLDAYTFSGCSSIKTMNIPNSVEFIGYRAFSDCTSLERIEFSDSVIEIDEQAFTGCVNLTRLKLSQNLETLGASAFESCHALKQISIPASVRSIGDSAFMFCSNLNQVTFEGDAPTIGRYAFQSVTANAYYPTGNNTWTENTMQNYGGNLTWKPMCNSHNYECSATPPTCADQGYTTYICVDCGYIYIDNYIDAAGHSFTVYVSDGNAACTQDGTKTSNCDRCDATDTVIDEGSAHGHDFTEWTMVQKPTETVEGLESRYCLNCGLEETRTIARQENPFTDILAGSYYYDPVIWAVENEITNGTSATTFGPNDQCMRAHVVTFLWRAVGCPEPTKTDNPFVDVKPSDFYYKPVLWAVENGITSGMDATHFGPTAYCNRAQVVTFLYRTVGSPAVDASQNPFTDVPAGQWFTAPVLWAVENGITNGLSATTFGPNTICNRAQIVTFLYRAFVD